MAAAPESPEFFIETLHPIFKGPEPAFFDKTQFEWAVEFEKKASQIIESLAPLLDDDMDYTSNLGRIKAEDKYFFPPQRKLWKGYYFYFHGIKIQPHLKKFPLLTEELAKIPNLVTANIAVLEPHAKILAHRGTTNGFLRCHLGLKIPASMPDCGFVVDGNEVSWRDGELWMFGDMRTHWGFNNTDKRRYILMLDVVRPEFVQYKKLLCVHQLSKYLTSVTGDYLREWFKVDAPILSHDPYNPNKKPEEKIATIAKRETRGQKLMRLTEDKLFTLYKDLFWIYYSVKKLQ